MTLSASISSFSFITPIEVPGRKKSVVLSEDETIRPDATMEDLARLRPAFGKDGTATAAIGVRP